MRLYFLALGTLLIVCVGCAHDGQQLLETNKNRYYAPPAAALQHPGPMVGGPGPGVMQVGHQVPGPPMGAMGAAPGGAPFVCPPGTGGAVVTTSQVRFLGPEGMHVGWQIGGGFAENQLMAPGRYNFRQAATYRLKFSNIPGREGLVVYPSLHIYPTHPTTAAYLEHNALPLRVNDEDLDQVETNNFVTKVIYLPDAKYQELAIAGVEELVSTRLAPGLDPVTEADRRGTIMAVLRMGNMDLEMPGQPGQLGEVRGANGEIVQTQYADGEKGQHIAPVPVGSHEGIGRGGVPSDMMVGTSGGPGQPAYDPISGVNGVPQYGMPYVGTPIGLPGPPHIPLGRPAGLQSITLRNTTDYQVSGPVEDMLIDVRHEPGIRMPEPVKYIQYTEKHPGYQASDLSVPAWAQQ
ncbi:hypothetical protein KOR42_00200 [Thalassoglobus neptunius]|uniref:Uncharacterized protein n=1 Tax=Thalassoglobus neptunius TaxID=1938619 RepID=A0A5C5X0Z7_9PLAN|nr:hypothetical protein [Thalassoglobus neptunius]TWT56667.1 hypothetical protein KOR42_00200 [Thalassoglobus neptunius]